jgi:hypothetical protein
MPHLIETSKNVNILKEDWISYTNKAGIFEVELEYDGIYEFTVAAENYAPQIVTVDTLKNRSFVAELVEGNKLSGRVIDSNGKPVKNAKLIPFTVNSKCSGYYNKSKLLLSEKYSCTTSDDGSFVLSNLPEKSETVKILHPNFIEKIMDIELPYSEKFVVTLARGGNIEGCVYDNNGNKKSHIIIYLTENKAGFADQNIVKETITDDNGCYEFTNVDSVPLYAKIRSTKIVEGVSCCYVLPEKDKTINLDLGGEFFLKGKVFIDNIPLASTPIAVIDSPSYIRSGFRNFGITEPDGSFMFSGITEGVKRLVYNYDVNDWRLITEFDSKGIDFDIGDIFIDVVNIEVEIDSDDVAEKCFVAENFMFPCENVFYMSSLGNNTFSAENIQPGKHVVMISTETSDGVFAKEIDVSNSEIPLKFNIKLPQANSSLYGHVDNRRPFIIKKEDNSFFTFYKNDYKLINIPAGKYVVETYPEKKVLTTFELEEGEELELDLDVILK